MSAIDLSKDVAAEQAGDTPAAGASASASTLAHAGAGAPRASDAHSLASAATRAAHATPANDASSARRARRPANREASAVAIASARVDAGSLDMTQPEVDLTTQVRSHPLCVVRVRGRLNSQGC